MKSSPLFAKILMTGGIVLGLELVASRIMTPFFGVSLYVWSSILSVTLLALAVGYKLGGILAGRMGRDRTLLVFAAAGALSALWMDICLWTYPFLFWPLADFDLVAGSIIACLYFLFIPLVILSALNPLLVPLLAATENKGDHGAGTVFFVSTVGSVLGVFAVTYGLLQHMTNYQTVALLTLILAVLSLGLLLMIGDFKNKAFKCALGLSIVVFLVTAGTLASGGLERLTAQTTYDGATWRIVHAEPSYFGHLQAVEVTSPDGRIRTRALLNDGLVQNSFSAPGVSASLYTYTLEELAYAAAIPDPKTALVLGIGGGVLPVAFERSGMQVHAVDINDKIVQIARDYFDFAPVTTTISIEDARTATRHCTRGYDIVAVDLFRDDGIPEHLVTQEFFSDIKNCMHDNGVMVMNSFMTMKDPAPEYALLQTIASVFGGVYFVQKPPQPGNDFTAAYLVARKGAPIRSLDVSTANFPPGLAPKFIAALDNARPIAPNDPELGGAPILSDISNQWKHLAHTTELEHRQSLVAKTPWQILMN